MIFLSNLWNAAMPASLEMGSWNYDKRFSPMIKSLIITHFDTTSVGIVEWVFSKWEIITRRLSYRRQGLLPMGQNCLFQWVYW